MSIFSSNKQDPASALAHRMSEAVGDVLNGSSVSTLVDTSVAGKLAMESESLGSVERESLVDAYSRVSKALLSVATESEQALTDAAAESRRTLAMEAAVQAGAYGALAAAGVNQHIKRDPFAVPSQASLPAGTSVISNYMGAYSHQRLAFEAYDNRDISNSVKASTALNYAAARQSAFGEMFWRTVVLAPDQTGYHMFLSEVNVLREVRREVNGKYSRYLDRVNALKANIDHTILENNDTDLYPVIHAGQNEDLFVAPGKIAKARAKQHGVEFETNYLKMGVDCSLLGISQNEALLRAGIMNETDAIDPAVNLSDLLLEIDNNVIAFGNLGYLTTSNFTPAPQGDSRQMNLNFNSQVLPMHKGTLKADKSPLGGALAAIATNEWTVHLKLTVTGTVNLQDAGHSLQATPITVASIQDKDGLPVDLTRGDGAAIVAAVKAASVLGYKLKARRVNSNKRTRGLLVDMSVYSILYVVPLLAPITARRSLAEGEAYNDTDLANLIYLTRTFVSNQAVTSLFNIAELLKTYATEKRMGSTLDTEYLGISRRLVTPHFEGDKVDVAKVVASLKSEDRPLQVQAVLVNKIRDMVFRAWYQSGLGLAADYLFGGNAPTPTVCIGTDPVTARYLQVQGDLRTIGGKFEVQIEHSFDRRMEGKIFIAFNYNTGDAETNYHALNFGMLLWKPEVVIAAPIYDQGQTSRELTMQPSCLNVCNTPVLMTLDVLNLDKAAVDLVAINTRVTP